MARNVKRSLYKKKKALANAVGAKMQITTPDVTTDRDSSLLPYAATKLPRNKEAFRQLLETIDDNSFHRGRQLGEKFATEAYDKKLKELNVEQERQKREACIRLMNAAGQLTEALSRMVLSINGHM